MANINELAKETLILLKQKGLRPTPENYTEIFEDLAQKRGYQGGVRQKIEKFKALLIPSQQEEIASRTINSLDEFLSFLISKINRQSSEKSPALFDLCEQIFKALITSKDKKIKELASMCLARFSRNLDNENLYRLEQKWKELSKTYLDIKLESELNKLGIKNDDYEATIKKLLSQLQARSYERFATLIALCLQPSLTTNESINEFEQKIKNKPYIIANSANTSNLSLANASEKDAFKEELMLMVSKRISTDMMFVQKNLNFFDVNLNKLSSLLGSLHKENANFLKEVSDSKAELSFEDLLQRLENLNEKISKISEEVKDLNDNKNREEFSLKTHILKLDEAFMEYKINYALCVFSVSNYRYIMEKYGVNNLSEILFRFKKILAGNCTDLDEVWLLDEKSYIVILRGKDYEQVLDFMQTNVSRIESFRFIYKQEVIVPKLSSFFLDKMSYPHINLLDEINKKLDDEEL